MPAPTIPIIDRDSTLVNPDLRPGILFFSWIQFVTSLFRRGFSGTIVTAKLTGGGANGSMTFLNGVLISQVAAT